MGKISMKARIEVIEKQKAQYKKASKKEKGLILTNICESTGYSRDRAARLLGMVKKEKATKTNKNEKRGRKIEYTKELVETLEKLWVLLDFSCGKRLKVGIPPMIEALERHEEMIFYNEIKQKLLKISASSIDRLLKPSKLDLAFKGVSNTKPGSLLKKDIPIRLGTEWDDAIPGYVEIDLVAHCGDSAHGEFVSTLDVTDICTGWTETRAVINKAQRHVFTALMHIESDMPFKYLGIDSDNGSEFINAHLYKYCKTNNICFTRGRPNKSNDNCYVEQKNWSVVRRNIGYYRYEGQVAVDALNSYYNNLRLYTNFFLPQAKLISKERIGSKVKKKYDAPKTPYQRTLENENISKNVKDQLTAIYLSLKPMAIKREMIKQLEILANIALPYASLKLKKEKVLTSTSSCDIVK